MSFRSQDNVEFSEAVGALLFASPTTPRMILRTAQHGQLLDHKLRVELVLQVVLKTIKGDLRENIMILRRTSVADH